MGLWGLTMLILVHTGLYNFFLNQAHTGFISGFMLPVTSWLVRNWPIYQLTAGEYKNFAKKHLEIQIKRSPLFNFYESTYFLSKVPLILVEYVGQNQICHDFMIFPYLSLYLILKLNS